MDVVLSKEAKNDIDKTLDKNKGEEITFMVPDWGNPGEELIKEFQEETGIKVIVNEVSWNDIRNKVAIAASGGVELLI